MSRKFKLKLGLIIFIFIFLVGTLLLAYWQTSNDDDYQMILQNDYRTSPVNVGKPINDVDPEKWAREHPDIPQIPSDLINGGTFNASEKQVLEALNKLLGKSYSKAWVKSITKTSAQNVNDWVYMIYPYTIAMYIEHGIFPSVVLAQTAEECGWGGSPLYKRTYNTGGMSMMTPTGWKAWKYASGNGGPRPEGGYYAKFDSWQDSIHSEVHAEDKQYHASKKTNYPDQIRQIAQGGWCADGNGGNDYYNRLVVYYKYYHLHDFDKYAQDVKNALSNVGGAVDGNKPTGGAGEWMPNGASSDLKKYNVDTSVMTQQASQFIGFADKYIGTKYVFGAAAGQDKTFDCSSFVEWNYNKVFNLEISRSTVSQEYEFHNSLKGKFKQINDNDAKPGDLVYFGPYGNSHHVGIFLKNNGSSVLLLHASNHRPYPAGGVKIGNHPWEIHRIYRYTGMY